MNAGSRFNQLCVSADKCVELEKNGVEIQHLGWQDCEEQILNEVQHFIQATQGPDLAQSCSISLAVSCYLLIRYQRQKIYTCSHTHHHMLLLLL